MAKWFLVVSSELCAVGLRVKTCWLHNMNLVKTLKYVKYLWTEIQNLEGILDGIGDFGRTENEILDSMFVQSLYTLLQSRRKPQSVRSPFSSLHFSPLPPFISVTSLHSSLLPFPLLFSLPFPWNPAKKSGPGKCCELPQSVRAKPAFQPNGWFCYIMASTKVIVCLIYAYSYSYLI